MNKKVCIFVDGENFRHSIDGLFDDFDKRDYLPKNADWTIFFDSLAGQCISVGNVFERIRTYWYVIQHIDFRLYSFPDANKNPTALRSLLDKSENYKKRLSTVTAAKIADEMRVIVAELKADQQRMKSRADQLQPQAVLVPLDRFVFGLEELVVQTLVDRLGEGEIVFGHPRLGAVVDDDPAGVLVADRAAGEPSVRKTGFQSGRMQNVPPELDFRK